MMRVQAPLVAVGRTLGEFIYVIRNACGDFIWPFFMVVGGGGLSVPFSYVIHTEFSY